MRKAGSFRLRSKTKLAPKIGRVIRERFIPHGFIYGSSDLVDARGLLGRPLKKIGLAK